MVVIGISAIYKSSFTLCCLILPSTQYSLDIMLAYTLSLQCNVHCLVSSSVSRELLTISLYYISCFTFLNYIVFSPFNSISFFFLFPLSLLLLLYASSFEVDAVLLLFYCWRIVLCVSISNIPKSKQNE